MRIAPQIRVLPLPVDGCDVNNLDPGLPTTSYEEMMIRINAVEQKVLELDGRVQALEVSPFTGR